MENVDWKNAYKMVWFIILLIIGIEYFGGKELFEFGVYLWTCSNVLEWIENGDKK